MRMHSDESEDESEDEERADLSCQAQVVEQEQTFGQGESQGRDADERPRRKGANNRKTGEKLPSAEE